jgi:hypothetical protein
MFYLIYLTPFCTVIILQYVLAIQGHEVSRGPQITFPDYQYRQVNNFKVRNMHKKCIVLPITFFSKSGLNTEFGKYSDPLTFSTICYVTDNF